MSNPVIAEQVTQQVNFLEQLATLLEQEKDILQQQTPEALIAVTEQKNQLLLSIEQLDKALNSNTDFINERQQGLHQDALNTCKQLLERCKEQNQINGEIIQQSQLAVERMKTTLLENHNRSAMTYDSKGKKSAGLSSLGLKA